MPTDPEPDDDLVAYLDGELADADAHAVEAKLAADADARSKAERLQKTYDLLDHLPKTEPSPNFASRTLTQIRPAATDGSDTKAVRQRQRPWKGVAWAVAFAAIAGAGYCLHLLARPHLEPVEPANSTSDHVRLLDRLPLLMGADDLEFVRQLDHPELFGEADSDHGAGRAGAETRTSAEIHQLESLFNEFPPARRLQLQKLDDDLARLPADRQAGLLTVLERYAIWLDRLPDNYRREVLTAPAAAERLDVVRRVKARMWREGLPPAVRERMTQADPPDRERLVAEHRLLDAERRETWDEAKREWGNIKSDLRPWPFDNAALTQQVDDYVEKVLKPRLTGGERNEVEVLRTDVATAADWLKCKRYGKLVVSLADQHPMYPEPATAKLVRSRDDLPKPFQGQLNRAAGLGRKPLNNLATGKWPEFALAVWTEANELKVPIPGNLVLGPNKPAEYTTPVREFLDGVLAKRLTKAERDELAKAEHGTWPDHSRKLIELAHKHDLSVPGVSLPGEPAMWDKLYRSRPGRK